MKDIILKLIALKNLFIFTAIDYLDGNDPKNKKIVCMLVNSTSMRNKIWKELYDKYANGTIEENWSENHFHEHISGFRFILYKYAGLTQKQLQRLDPNENFKLKWLEKREHLLGLLKADSLKEMNILGKLYAQCANGKIEDNWSENHFHEYLQTLQKLLSDELSQRVPNTGNDSIIVAKRLLVIELWNEIQALNDDKLSYLVPD